MANRKKQHVKLHEQGKWYCWKCEKTKKAGEFSPVERYWMGHDYICKPCSTARRTEWRRENPWRARAKEINRRCKVDFVDGDDLREIWDRYNGKCYYCEKQLVEEFGNREIEFDHVKPKVNKKENLVLACRSCNTKKNDMTVKQLKRFVKKIEEHEIAFV